MRDENKPFDPFKRTAAILLGLGAVGALVLVGAVGFKSTLTWA